MQERIKLEITKSIATLSLLLDDKFLDEINAIAEICTKTILNGNKILFVGNGGSAADCQHLAAELVGRFSYDRPGIKAIALTTDTSAITAIGNDYGYEKVFSRQVEAIGNKGDVLVAISTSGNSANIIEAITTAKDMEIQTIGFSGKTGGQIKSLCDAFINIPSSDTAHIQEAHITIGHIICSIIEDNIFGQDYDHEQKTA